jgi:hypothetical protein
LTVWQRSDVSLSFSIQSLQVTVRTSITELEEYLQHLLKVTNMKCLTPESALAGECNYLAVNLYARSVFGEDALANLSIEKLADGSVSGCGRWDVPLTLDRSINSTPFPFFPTPLPRLASTADGPRADPKQDTGHCHQHWRQDHAQPKGQQAAIGCAPVFPSGLVMNGEGDWS